MTKSERTRQHIIEQSAVVFNTKGIAGTSMSDIMEATQLAKGGLYGHFESKEELALAVVDYNLGQLISKSLVAVAKATGAKDKLFAFLDFFKNPINFPIMGGCPMVNFGAEADDTNPLIREKIKKVLLHAQHNVATVIQNGIKNGELKPTFNAKEFSILVLTVMEGGMVIGRVMESNSQMAIVIKMLKKQIEEQTT